MRYNYSGHRIYAQSSSLKEDKRRARKSVAYRQARRQYLRDNEFYEALMKNQNERFKY